MISIILNLSNLFYIFVSNGVQIIYSEYWSYLINFERIENVNNFLTKYLSTIQTLAAIISIFALFLIYRAYILSKEELAMLKKQYDYAFADLEIGPIIYNFQSKNISGLIQADSLRISFFNRSSSTVSVRVITLMKRTEGKLEPILYFLPSQNNKVIDPGASKDIEYSLPPFFDYSETIYDEIISNDIVYIHLEDSLGNRYTHQIFFSDLFGMCTAIEIEGKTVFGDPSIVKESLQDIV
ncbi:MAG: hypothetical protein JW885_10010 [Deltaproteobacteria bacterium]|nr:hypothetical protein [Candidatus Zymogenaceae bacterium]